MSKYETTHLSPSEIDRLRLQAFVTNSQDDMNAYYRAASLYFQERDVRAMNRADRIEELEAEVKSMAMDCLVAKGQASDAYQAQLLAEAKLAKAVAFLEFLDGNYRHVWGDTARAKIRELYAELKGQDDD